MNRSSQDHVPGRRAVLAEGLALSATALVSAFAMRRAWAVEKLPKAAVQYDEATRMPGRDCDDCVQFIAGPSAQAMGACRIVAGDISPHGHCIAFSPRSKR